MTQLQRMPSFLSTRKEFSTASPKASSNGKPPESNSNLPKVVLGSAVLAGAAVLAYQSGYLDQFIGKEKQGSLNSVKVGIDHKDVKVTQHLGEQVVSEESNKSSRYVEKAAQKVESPADVPHIETEQKGESCIDPQHVETEQRVDSHIDLPRVEAEQKVETQTDLPHRDTLSKTQSFLPLYLHVFFPIIFLHFPNDLLSLTLLVYEYPEFLSVNVKLN